MHSDLIYQQLPENPNDEDRLNVVFNLLFNDRNITLDYHKLKIDDSREKSFDAKLKKTGFVEYSQSPSAFSPTFNLNDEGQLIMDENDGSYLRYLDKLQAEKEQNENNDEIAIKNKILNQINTKHVGSPYWIDQLINDTKIDNDVIMACLEIFKKDGYIEQTNQEVSIRTAGKLFVKTGGYKKDAIKTLFNNTGHIGDIITHGDGSHAVAGNLSIQLKEKDDKISSLTDELAKSQIALNKSQTDLAKVQSREIKNKWIYGTFAGIGGIIIALTTAYLLGVLHLNK